MQSLKGNRYASRAVKRNELNKKNDVRRKIANFVVREAERLGAAIAVENLPKNAPRNMIKDVDDPKLRDRIYKAGFRSMLREIIRKARERGIPVVKVNPRGTSSSCPRCGACEGLCPETPPLPPLRAGVGEGRGSGDKHRKARTGEGGRAVAPHAR
ncbi:IS200/IS605 family accessory protein TnpB-related protein [Pyrobaculum islandicum]|uniref:IS200/IS605 family accessory protein TnpB-related protein n=1 Tax=Pyrobaculum islandicum TaxID=2277 RepID=UPI000ADA7AB3|nr:IS200/IS605 family accessory protein TnpB-related protein [Pyrobaculum islandicum]